MLLTAALLLVASCLWGQESVTRIWDEGYSAFPSIERYGGRYYVTFREAEGHVFDRNGKAAGRIRILASDDGSKWESVALLSKEGFDLRDPKLSVTPDGRLMVILGGSVYDDMKVLRKRIPHVSFSTDGVHFSDPVPTVFEEEIANDRQWIWRVTWNGDTGYAVAYGKHFALFRTRDGLFYEHVTELDVDGEPNETTLRFLPDGRMAMMIRREKDDRRGYWAVGEYPYKEWKFIPMDVTQLGGPDFMLMEDGSVLAGTRSSYIKSRPKMVLLRGDLEGNFEEVRLLPSGGDCSYPGFLKVGNELWVVYYSSHELKRAAIYLAKFKYDEFICSSMQTD